jgi:hypothetical protein
VILIVFVELWNSQHCFGKHSKESNNFGVDNIIKEYEGNIATDKNKHRNRIEIIHKVRPLPKMLKLKI